MYVQQLVAYAWVSDEKEKGVTMINGLRLKNALLCQTGEGKKYCKHCSYNNDDKCDIKKLSSDVLEYIKTGEDTFNMLQDELLKHMKVSEGDLQIERINKHNSSLKLS